METLVKATYKSDGKEHPDNITIERRASDTTECFIVTHYFWDGVKYQFIRLGARYGYKRFSGAKKQLSSQLRYNVEHGKGKAYITYCTQ